MRVALIGCGRATEQLHLPALRHVPEAEVVALADVDSDRLRLVANRYRVARRYTDYQDLINDPDVEAVCVPAHSHTEVGSAAKAGTPGFFLNLLRYPLKKERGVRALWLACLMFISQVAYNGFTCANDASEWHQERRAIIDVRVSQRASSGHRRLFAT